MTLKAKLDLKKIDKQFGERNKKLLQTLQKKRMIIGVVCGVVYSSIMIAYIQEGIGMMLMVGGIVYILAVMLFPKQFSYGFGYPFPAEIDNIAIGFVMVFMSSAGLWGLCFLLPFLWR